MEFVAKHKVGAVAAGKAAAESKLWEGTFNERTEKLRIFHAALCDVYDIDTDLVIDTEGGEVVEASGFYSDENDTIVLRPGFAIMTYLRLFAIAVEVGRGQAYSAYEGENSYAARWANGLFKKAFPKSWDKLVARNAKILTRDYA